MSKVMIKSFLFRYCKGKPHFRVVNITVFFLSYAVFLFNRMKSQNGFPMCIISRVCGFGNSLELRYKLLYLSREQ